MTASRSVRAGFESAQGQKLFGTIMLKPHTKTNARDIATTECLY